MAGHSGQPHAGNPFAGDLLLGESLGVLTPLAQGVLSPLDSRSAETLLSLLKARVFLGGCSTVAPLSPLVCLRLRTRPSVTAGLESASLSLSLSTLTRDCLRSVTPCVLLEAG